jgi:hypothetical protein
MKSEEPCGPNPGRCFGSRVSNYSCSTAGTPDPTFKRSVIINRTCAGQSGSANGCFDLTLSTGLAYSIFREMGSPQRSSCTSRI